MMENYLHNYRITLTVKGPLFVGNGRTYTRCEYIKMSQDLIGIVNFKRLYEFICQRKLARQFEHFILGNRPILDSWLYEMRLTPEVKKNCIDYVLSMKDVVLQNSRPQIKACIKDAYGHPYIPGSSLKGCLRTILATAKIMEDETMRDDIRQSLESNMRIQTSRTRYLSETSRYAEAKIFRTLKRDEKEQHSAVNDVMQGFIVGDSEPITDYKALMLAQKIERHIDSQEGREKKLPILRESLRPGTKIHFPLTLNTRFCPFTVKDIISAVHTFDEMYNENFLQKFRGMDRLRADIPQIFLGGGTGFVSKTLVYPTLGQRGVEGTINIFANTKVPFKHNHRNDKNLGVSPHVLKCTYYKGRTVQMGLCEIAIE